MEMRAIAIERRDKFVARMNLAIERIDHLLLLEVYKSRID